MVGLSVKENETNAKEIDMSKTLYRVKVIFSEQRYADFLADSAEEAEDMAEELLNERFRREDSGFTFEKRNKGDLTVLQAFEIDEKN